MTTSVGTSLDDISIAQYFMAEFDGQELSQVIFVMDYMQLVFYEKRLTLNVWPKLIVDGIEHGIEWLGYEKTLRTLIGHEVVNAEMLEGSPGFAFSIGFAEVRVTPSIGDLSGPEIVAFTADSRGTFAIWHEGHAPFVDLD